MTSNFGLIYNKLENDYTSVLFYGAGPSLRMHVCQSITSVVLCEQNFCFVELMRCCGRQMLRDTQCFTNCDIH